MQYIFLCCPEGSIWQYHPFALTSAPEEDFISVHIRIVGDFTKALGKALGCNLDKTPAGEQSEKGGSSEEMVLRKILPPSLLMVLLAQLPRMCSSFEVAILVEAGIGVTPFAPILKSIWYRIKYPQARTRLQKVFFFPGSVETLHRSSGLDHCSWPLKLKMPVIALKFTRTSQRRSRPTTQPT